MKFTATILALGFSSTALLQSGLAQASTPASVQMSVDGTPWQTLTLIVTGQDDFGLPIYNLNPGGAAYRSTLTGLGFRDETGQPLTGPGWVFGAADSNRIAFTHTTADTDPFISYAISVIDSGAPSNFSFTFSTPIALAYGSTLTRASVGATLTDGWADGAILSNLVQDSYLNTTPAVDMAVDIGPVSLSAPSGDTAAQAYSIPFGLGPLHLLANPFTLLTIVTTFSLSGGDDNVGLTGRAEIIRDPIIPEPGSAALLLAGLGALATRRVRPRSTRL